MDNDPNFTVTLSLDEMYLLSELLRSRIKDLGDFTSAEREIDLAASLLETIAAGKVTA